MANRNFNDKSWSMEKKAVTLYATVDFNSTSAPALKSWAVASTGGAGAYTTTTTGYKGIASVARTAQGKYTFTLSDPYVRLLGVSATFKAIDGVTSPLALNWFVMTETVATTKTIVIGATGSAGSATLTDWGANDRVLFAFVLSDSSAQ